MFCLFWLFRLFRLFCLFGLFGSSDSSRSLVLSFARSCGARIERRLSISRLNVVIIWLSLPRDTRSERSHCSRPRWPFIGVNGKCSMNFDRSFGAL